MSRPKIKNAVPATMTLLDEAERAGKVRNALTNFVGPCVKNALEIEKTITALSNLGLALREIDDLIESNDGAGLKSIRPDLEDVHDDITFALAGAWECIGQMGRAMQSEDYRQAWKSITTRSKASCGKSLHRELDESRVVLEELSARLKGYAIPAKSTRSGDSETPSTNKSRASSKSDVKDIRGRPLATRAKTDVPIETRLHNLSIGQPTKQKSYERQRSGRPMSPADSNASSSTDASLFKGGRFPLSPPLSPIATASTVSNVSSSAASIMASTTHWAPRVFRSISETKLPSSLEQTRYHEPRTTVTEHSMPDSAYESVFHLSYPGSLRLTLFVRPSDGRAKAVCFYTDYMGRNEYSCLPIDQLHLKRDGPLLRIYCQRDVKHERWVTMRFGTYERQILFANMLLALRSQDGGPLKQNVPVTDDELRDEVSEFGASIKDEPFKHVLRICSDKITGSIRLVASVRGGVQDRMPVWTAFVSKEISNPEWCRLVSRDTVMLSRLNARMFTSTYELKHTSTGAVMLRFEIPDDAEAFVRTVRALRR